MVVASRAARKGVRSGATEGAKERARARAKGDALSRVFCVKVILGPVIVLHGNGGKGRRVVSSGKGSKSSLTFFDKHILEGDTHDWVTGAGAFTSSAELCQFRLRQKVHSRFWSHTGHVRRRTFEREFMRSTLMLVST